MRQLDPAKREAIITAASTGFQKRGLKVSMQSIARAAGIAVGTLYLYFPTKDHLLAACVQAYTQVHREAIERALSSPEPAAQCISTYVQSRYEAGLATRLGGTRTSELAAHVLKVFPERRAEEAMMMANTVETLLQRGVDSGEVTVRLSPQSDTMTFLHAVAWFFRDPREVGGDEPPREHLVAIVDWFCRLWTNGSGSS